MTTNETLRRRRISLAITLFATLAGAYLGFDIVLLAMLAAAFGLLWSTRGRQGRVLAAALLATGLLWSHLDSQMCSLWWRGQVLYAKLAGHLPYVPWNDVGRRVVSPCRTFASVRPEIAKRVHLIENGLVNGRPCERYDTDLGKFWIERPGREIMDWLVWELTVQGDYESRDVVIRPGDTVIDCGAHVGTFSAYALKRGAARVVAIEPDPTNIALIEKNLAREIAAGRVLLVRAGVWDQKAVLTLTHNDENSAAHSFVREYSSPSKVPGVPVLPLDEIVTQLHLERVDFIKMDIEGAERRALAGALQTITRFSPRMAICVYHAPDDRTVVPAVIRKAAGDYEVHAKDIEFAGKQFTPKVLFFFYRS